MDSVEYEALIEARDHAIAMRAVAAGVLPVIPDDEMDAYLASPTPFAFWRRRSGKTQAALAAETALSQAFLAQIEAGQRQGRVDVLAKLARALGTRIEDLIVD